MRHSWRRDIATGASKGQGRHASLSGLQERRVGSAAALQLDWTGNVQSAVQLPNLESGGFLVPRDFRWRCVINPTPTAMDADDKNRCCEEYGDDAKAPHIQRAIAQHGLESASVGACSGCSASTEQWPCESGHLPSW